MNEKIKNRFLTAYQKIYGIIPELAWDGTYYRSAHLPRAMIPKDFVTHTQRLEGRVEA